MKKGIILFFGLCLFLNINAQNLNHNLISSGGCTSINKSINLDWSVGQIVNTTVGFSDGILTQGFLQPFLTLSPVIIQNQLVSEYATVWPNPTRDFIKIKTGGYYNENNWSIVNIAGKIIKVNSTLKDDYYEVDLHNEPIGTYYILFFNEKGEVVESIGVVKTN
ncbi:MAG: T9SS type A sorting domain-containing protein [Saprospiraceae bacterium]|nr:T9SS type A sorting domain-containing protein [Saprospiraceae bacterium]